MTIVPYFYQVTVRVYRIKHRLVSHLIVKYKATRSSLHIVAIPTPLTTLCVRYNSLKTIHSGAIGPDSYLSNNKTQNRIGNRRTILALQPVTERRGRRKIAEESVPHIYFQSLHLGNFGLQSFPKILVFL